MSKLQYEVFLRSIEFERASADMRMRPADWRLLLALDGRVMLGDLAQRLFLDVEEAVDTIALCERLGIVERRRISLAEYRAEFAVRLAAAVRPEAPAEAPAGGPLAEAAAPEDLPEPFVALAGDEAVEPAVAAGEPSVHDWVAPEAPAPAVAEPASPEAAASYEHAPVFHAAAFEAMPFERAPQTEADPTPEEIRSLGEASEARLASFHERREDQLPSDDAALFAERLPLRPVYAAPPWSVSSQAAATPEPAPVAPEEVAAPAPEAVAAAPEALAAVPEEVAAAPEAFAAAPETFAAVPQGEVAAAPEESTPAPVFEAAAVTPAVESEAAQPAFPEYTERPHIADLPLAVLAPHEAEPQAAQAPEAPEAPFEHAAVPKPIEFKLRPSVSVVIR